MPTEVVVESQLIAAPMLQDLLVDKLGQPLSNGIVTFYGPDKATLKNWYYQSGISPGPYTYPAGPNPMTLSAAGTFVDVSGNDVIPFFYPFSTAQGENGVSEPYFITVYDQFGTFQFSRSNFPFNGNQQPAIDTETLAQYIINNRFWRNIGTINVSTIAETANSGNWTTQYNIAPSSVYYQRLAPSQHDGFSMPDFNYIKDINGATETITFTKFIPTNPAALTGDITPEWYIHHDCSGAIIGQTLKCYQFPVSLHVETLSNVTYTFTFQAQSISGAAQIDIFVYQFLGTGVMSPMPMQVYTTSVGANWTKYQFTATFPSAVPPLTLGNGADDAIYIQIGMPLTANFVMNFTLPTVYLGEVSATNSFETYDQIDTIINSPRTGDIRTSLNNFSPFGWVPLDDGTIGNAASMATTRANIDTWQLYYLLWNSVNNTFAPVSTGRGASAIADFNANKTINLTLALGRAILGLPPAATVTYDHTVTPTWGLVAGTFTAASTVLLYVGAPVTLSGTVLPGAFTANTIYYVIPAIDGSNTTEFQLATTYALALAGTAIAASGTVDGTALMINAALSGAFGQSRHVQLVNELAQHAHTVPWSATANTGGGGVSGVVQLAEGSTSTSTIPSSATVPSNIVQPSVYLNVFMKL